MLPTFSSLKDWYCDIFDLLVGLIFYTFDMENANIGMDAVANLLLEYSDPFELDNAAYYAMYLNSAVPGGVQDPILRHDAHTFCYSPILNKTCNIMTFDIFGSSDYSVSNFYYELFEGACTDSFTIGEEEW